MKKPTKIARTTAARAVIDRNKFGVPFSPEDVQEMNAHCGTEHTQFTRHRNAAFPADPRHLHNEAGPFSWNKAITQPHELTDPQRALRAAIAPLMREFMEDTEQTQCVKCGSADHLTVDHTPPFISIATEFMALHGVPALAHRKDGAGWVLKDDDEAAWVPFHQSRVTLLQVLCRSCNASKGAR
jgi:hypothetical protein